MNKIRAVTIAYSTRPTPDGRAWGVTKVVTYVKLKGAERSVVAEAPSEIEIVASGKESKE